MVLISSRSVTYLVERESGMGDKEEWEKNLYRRFELHSHNFRLIRVATLKRSVVPLSPRPRFCSTLIPVNLSELCGCHPRRGD